MPGSSLMVQAQFGGPATRFGVQSDMLRLLTLCSALTALSLPGFAAAAGGSADVTGRVAAAGIQLAQAGDVEIYYDGQGRRVIVDAYTGEIIAVEPRTMPPRSERYYLDDPEDMARLRRDQEAEIYREAPPDDGTSIWRDDGLGADPQGTFPEAPSDDPYGEPPLTAGREPVERAPLAPGAEPGQDNGVVIIEPNSPATIEPPMTSAARIEVAELQVLLDRKGASPGVIDGHFGSNVDKGLAAYRSLTGAALRSTDAAGIKAALAESGGDAFVDYTITAEDAAGPFVAAVPEDYGEKAKLERLGYTSVAEMLAERFHMDVKYLKALNPEANFGRPGTIIRVAAVGSNVTAPVTSIVADKYQKQVRAYDAAGKLVVAYPATIGSSDTPSPSGTHTVARVALNPDYTYNPNINFKQGENHDILKIPPGPNGPVGSVWIALSKPTYGIHGTPEPSKIGKTESHGCVRLTNWDAQELAKLVKPGVTVEFAE